MFSSRQRMSDDALQDRVVALETVIGNNMPRISVCEDSLSQMLARIEGLSERITNTEARIVYSPPAEPMAEIPSEALAAEPARPPATHRGEGTLPTEKPKGFLAKRPASVTIGEPMTVKNSYPSKFLDKRPEKNMETDSAPQIFPLSPSGSTAPASSTHIPTLPVPSEPPRQNDETGADTIKVPLELARQRRNELEALGATIYWSERLVSTGLN